MSKTLVVTKGLPGSGKTTFLKNKGLDPYVISTDQIRNLIASPIQNESGKWETHRSFEKQVRKLGMELVENRLSRGDLTIVDATHTKLSMWNEYKQLANKYNCRLVCLDFSDVDIETAKKQNRMRPEYQQVEDFVIERFKDQLDILEFPKDIEVIRSQEWDEKFIWEMNNFSHYRQIHHFGDIHGCNEPLKEFFQEGLKEDELYIFVGDYVDRGIQNAEVVSFLFSIMDRENVIFLEGNHEIHLHKWANNLPAFSKEFQRYTKPELEQANVSRKMAQRFCDKLEKAVYYTYNEKTVLVTHGGIIKIPENLLYLSSEQMVRGVGTYDTPVDTLFSENNPSDSYQIHGHRNTSNLPILASNNSFNLEGGIEEGGYLRVLSLGKDGFTSKEIKNNVISTRYEEVVEKTFDNQELLEELQMNKYIKELKQDRFTNISSFNFKRKVFTKKLWNKQTIKSRGLFINTKTKEIVSRSYDKFFNIKEREETSLEKLQDNMVFPINLYLKENGFLGIVGYDHSYKSLILSTKNYIYSKHADFFRELFNKQFSLTKEEKMIKIVRDQNISLIFEVVDPINDPHIIEYQEPKLVLLDAMYREENMRKFSYDKLFSLGKELDIQVKEKSYIFHNWEEFTSWYERSTEDFSLMVEGYVIEDAEGFMTKIKSPYYSFWKRMRTQVEKIEFGLQPSEDSLKFPLGKQFLEWYIKLEKRNPDWDIISLRNQFQLENKLN